MNSSKKSISLRKKPRSKPSAKYLKTVEIKNTEAFEVVAKLIDSLHDLRKFLSFTSSTKKPVSQKESVIPLIIDYTKSDLVTQFEMVNKAIYSQLDDLFQAQVPSQLFKEKLMGLKRSLNKIILEIEQVFYEESILSFTQEMIFYIFIEEYIAKLKIQKQKLSQLLKKNIHVFIQTPNSFKSHKLKDTKYLHKKNNDSKI